MIDRSSIRIWGEGFRVSCAGCQEAVYVDALNLKDGKILCSKCKQPL